MKKASIHATRLCFDPRTRSQTPLEIALLKYCPRHANIIGYIDSWEDDECWYLVTEVGGFSWDQVSRDQGLPRSHASNGHQFAPRKCDRVTFLSGDNLGRFQHILIPRRGNSHSMAGFLKAYTGGSGKIKEQVQKRIFRQLVDSIATLHRHGIVHRDLKDENVLLDADLTPHLIDFGHAAFYRCTNTNPEIPNFKSYGTPLFAPPEVRSGQTFVGPEGDVYALGLMLYEMNYGDLPEDVEEARLDWGNVCRFDMSRMSIAVREICMGLLCPNPRQRWRLDDLLNSPWLREI
jgi:serine/threonine protein kinase